MVQRHFLLEYLQPSCPETLDWRTSLRSPSRHVNSFAPSPITYLSNEEKKGFDINNKKEILLDIGIGQVRSGQVRVFNVHIQSKLL